MASNYRPMPTDLINTQIEVGNSFREARERSERISSHSAKLEQFMCKANSQATNRANFCLDRSQHGAPSNFNIVETRQRQRGEYVRTRSAFARAQHEEREFERLLMNQSDATRLSRARHARRAQRAVVGTNFVPDTIEDLPECERAAVVRSRQNCVDKLHYEIKNTDRLRDGWRLQKERSGHIIAPPIGKVGVC